MPRTNGLSPKVAAVIAALGGPGVILLILGLVLKDETLKTIGLSLLGGGALGGAAGYKASPGDVHEAPAGAPSDDVLLASRETREWMQGGYSIVEALLVVFLVLVILIVVFRFA